jgi:hypothetical protein
MVKIAEDTCEHKWEFTGGGCCYESEEDEVKHQKPCDDEFKCNKCGETITVLSSHKIHLGRKINSLIEGKN